MQRKLHFVVIFLVTMLLLPYSPVLAQVSGVLSGPQLRGTVRVNSNSTATEPTLVCSPVDYAQASGYVFFDDDNNGIYGSNEPGVGGVQITIATQNDNGQMETVGQLKTDAKGFWQKLQLCPGSYQVTLDKSTLPSGTRFDGDASKQITLASGDQQNNINFIVGRNVSNNTLLPLLLVLLVILALVGFASYQGYSRRRPTTGSLG